MARTGRPRSFDRDAALESATGLFWQHGYEATSLDQLKRAMGGISSASFYAAFGSKEALYREVLARYLATHGQVTASLKDEAFAPREAIERALRLSARMQTDTSHPTGCLIVLATSVTSKETEPLIALAAAERQVNRTAIQRCVEAAIASGELRKDTDPIGVATMVEGMLLGFSMQARDGVESKALDAAVNSALVVWDAHRTSNCDGPRL